MPTIQKAVKKPRQKYGKSAEATKIYGTVTWRRLRMAKLMDNPLCELCLQNGKTTPATDVHHIKPIQSTDDELQMKTLAYDYNNLMSLCEQCHYNLHSEQRSK